MFSLRTYDMRFKSTISFDLQKNSDLVVEV